MGIEKEIKCESSSCWEDLSEEKDVKHMPLTPEKVEIAALVNDWWALSADRTNETALAIDAQKERSLPDRQSKPDGNVTFALLYSPLNLLFTVIVLIFGTI